MKGFVWDKIRLLEIRRDALRYLCEDFDGKKIANTSMVSFYYYWVPLILSGGLIWFNVRLTNEISTYLITGISIFAGLFFNLLIVVSDKMNKRKRLLNSKAEHEKDYAIKYQTF